MRVMIDKRDSLVWALSLTEPCILHIVKVVASVCEARDLRTDLTGN